jgi:2-succinyl-5-enolpyruvyl-6-hydroxy-3-cyclohexene-1-carboxylate synthase
MNPPADTYLLLRAFVDELARCGMRAACTSPGSRSAPLVLSLANEPRLRCYSHIDERCAGFFALGLAKATGQPVAVACTSGTAAAELLPAAVEAREARVPLLLLTADRPPELREVGAGQAIDQLGIYGSAAKWFVEVDPGGAGERELRWMRALACRSYWTALEGRAGAVHLNFPLREPLVGDFELARDDTARADGAPYVARLAAGPGGATGTEGTGGLGTAGGTVGAAAREQLGALLGGERRGVVVAGREERSRGFAQAVASFAATYGWPLLADPMSGARRGDAAIAHYDALLRDAGFAGGARPDVVLRVGDLPVSKPLRGWLASLAHVAQIALDPEGAWQDPDSVLTHSLRLDPARVLPKLTAQRLDGAGERAAPADWLASWRSADELAAEAISGELHGDALSEPAVAAELGVLLAEDVTLFVASSMPVREIETFWPVREDPPRVLCNRGANGIDGTVAAAFGAAAAGDPVVLLIGDVALAYDIGALLCAGRLHLHLTIVLVDNGGGGIFDFLPVARAPMARAGAADGAGEDLYTRHVATPTGLDFAAAAALYGLAHEPVQTLEQLRAALERAIAGDGGGATIVHVRTSRADNVALHGRIWDAVAGAVSR